MWMIFGMVLGGVVDWLLGRPRSPFSSTLRVTVVPGVDPEAVAAAINEVRANPAWLRVDFERALWKRGLSIDLDNVIRNAVSKPIDGVAGDGGN